MSSAAGQGRRWVYPHFQAFNIVSCFSRHLQGTIAAQFNCEGTTLSGVDFELVGPGYRLSLVKKRFVSGNYVSKQRGELLLAHV